MKWLLSGYLFFNAIHLLAAYNCDVTSFDLPADKKTGARPMTMLRIVDRPSGQERYECHSPVEAPFRVALLEDSEEKMEGLLREYVVDSNDCTRIIQHALKADACIVLDYLLRQRICIPIPGPEGDARESDVQRRAMQKKEARAKRHWWFEKLAHNAYRFKWRTKEGLVQSYDSDRNEALIMRYLIEDKTDDGIHTLEINPTAAYGPSKQRAVAMAVLGNRRKCAQALLTRGDGDDILDTLLHLANDHESLHAMKHLIVERAWQVLAKHKAGQADA